MDRNQTNYGKKMLKGKEKTFWRMRKTSNIETVQQCDRSRGGSKAPTQLCLDFVMLAALAFSQITGNNVQSSSRLWFCIACHKFSHSCQKVCVFAFKNNFKTSLKYYFWWQLFLRNPADGVKKLSEIILSHRAIFYEEFLVGHFY